MNICIIVANYYKEISKNLINGTCVELDRYNRIKSNKHKLKYRKIIVPGIFEIPFVISSNIKKFDGFISLGCVIKGETPHFDFISTAAINGILNLSIQHRKPITNGILTCLNKKQAIVRAGVNKRNKGSEAARALIHLINL
mgnify:CR=1 FL=1|jgi:6,7-dimethyl-8-ribityllumazine synthase|tara:strand:+ start:59 stop:481 length:423 start_codon:yes stop_codon:yes gene_type:complete